MGRRRATRTASETGPDLVAEVERLYGLPLGEFVRARNSLTAQWRRQGRASEATEVAALKKPSPAVWAINQVARQEPEAVARFLEAVQELRRVQAGRRGVDMAAATESHRAALGRLVEGAGAALTRAGLRVSSDTLRRISGTVTGAAADRRHQADLRRGRLTREVAAPGFELFADVPRELVEREEAVPRSRGRTGESAADRKARERLLRAQEALQVARSEAETWRQRAEDLEGVAARRMAAAEEAAAAIAELRERLASAEARLTEERRAAEQAGREAERARRDAERATARREAAEKVLRAARQGH